MTNKTSIFLIFAVILGVLVCLHPAQAADEEQSVFRSTPYPLPRFVTLRADEVYVRSGPGTKYPIKFVFKKKGLPVEVILEYEVWRKIKDHTGDEGWVHQSLISGARTGLIQAGPGELVPFYSEPKDGARLIARAEGGTLGKIDECRGHFCRLEISGYRGWVPQEAIWGVYQSEIFN